jgi:hypothetical protein
VFDGLAKQMEDEITEGVRKYPDLYEFDVSRIKEFLGNGQVITKSSGSIFNVDTVDETVEKEPLLNDVGTPITDLSPSAKKQSMNIDANTNVVKGFEDMIRSSGHYQRLLLNFWKTFEGNEKGASVKGKSPYVDWFAIKPKIDNFTKQGLDPITKMYPKRFTYQAIPYKIHILKLVTAGMSFGDVDWEQYARRKYNYIYTGDNVDIQNLRINYKVAYYYRNVRKDAKAQAGEQGWLNSKVEDLKTLFGVEKKAPEPSLLACLCLGVFSHVPVVVGNLVIDPEILNVDIISCVDVVVLSPCVLFPIHITKTHAGRYQFQDVYLVRYGLVSETFWIHFCYRI